MSPVRFGLIGYGAWGSHHARAIAAVPGAELVAVAAHSEASCAKARADYPHARVHADYRDLLAEGLAVGHELRLSSLWGRVKELIDEGAIGEPLYALVELWRRPYRLGSGGWRYDISRVGNWILEEPIHFFDLARWYFAGVGEPVSVYARANGKRPDRPELHDNFSAVLTFPRGRYAVVSQTLAAWEHHQTAKITGTEGALWATWSGATDRTFEPTFGLKLMRGEEVSEVPIATPPGEVYELVAQVARVAAAARGTAAVACTGEDGRRAVALCLKAEESLRREQPVPITGG